MHSHCRFELVYPPWAVARDGGAELDRAHGEVGFDGLVIPVVTGAISAFRPTAAPDAIFVSEGGWHFRPEPEHYRSSGIRARVAAWVGRRESLAPLVEFGQRHNLPLTYRIDASALGALLQHEPALLTRCAWDGGPLGRAACPSNPVWRALLADISADLARFKPAALELVGLELDAPATESAIPEPLREIPQVPPLLGLCFCPACREIGERAGVEVEAVMRSVRVHTERLCRQPGDAGAQRALERDEALQAYRQSRTQDHGAWLARLADKAAAPGVRMLSADPEAFAGISRVALLGGAQRAALCEASEALGAALASGCIGVCMPVWRPCFRAADELVRAAHRLASSLELIEFGGLESAIAEATDWLRQAVRYSRRG